MTPKMKLIGDCISRELLKKDIDAQISYFDELNKKGEPYKGFKDIRAILFGLFIGKNLIDNIPTVDLSAMWAEAHSTGYDVGYNKAKGEFKRPQGEWIDLMTDKGYVECPFCHKQITGGDLNFCVKCGADMRKGGTE